MTNDPKDRHVLAAAVASGAQVVVTLNLKDFPPESCEPLAIEPLHPDVFLMDLYGLDDAAQERGVSGEHRPSRCRISLDKAREMSESWR